MNARQCYEAVLPSLNLCLPRSYFTFKNFKIEDKVGYDWKTFFLPVSDDVEAGNELTLLIPFRTLPILPQNYQDDNHKMVLVSLRPMYLTTEQRQSQFVHYQGNTVFKTDDKDAFIHCDHLDTERGNPSAQKYCFLKMDLDANIRNPRIELSFSIAPKDFSNWRENSEKVKAFLVTHKK